MTERQCPNCYAKIWNDDHIICPECGEKLGEPNKYSNNDSDEGEFEIPSLSRELEK